MEHELYDFPTSWEWWSNLTNIFQRGWNHQPEMNSIQSHNFLHIRADADVLYIVHMYCICTRLYTYCHSSIWNLCHPGQMKLPRSRPFQDPVRCCKMRGAVNFSMQTMKVPGCWGGKKHEASISTSQNVWRRIISPVLTANSCQNLYSLTCWCVELLLDVMILEGNIDWNPNVYTYIYIYMSAS